MWETPNARVAMFSKILKSSKDAGAWKTLHENIIPEWIDAGLGFHYTTKDYDENPGAKVDGTTRTPFFRVNNIHGGESTCMLFSMANEGEAEEKLKEKQFSLIYFAELSNFLDRRILSMSLLCLRMPHLKYIQQQFIADTNPSEEGEASWIYETWYVEQKLDYDEYVIRQTKLKRPVMKESAFMTNVKNGRHVIEILPKDNPRLEPEQLEELEGAYAWDPGLYARYLEGKWIYGDGDASRHFMRFYKKNVHDVGTSSDPDETLWEKAVPSPNCTELILGLDTGDVNHAGVVIEKTYHPIWEPRFKRVIQQSCFTIIDEVVNLNTPMPLHEFTGKLLDVIDELEAFVGRQLNLERAYSDMSAFTDYSATGDTYPAREIESVSMGRIALIGVPKYKGSVEVRVRLVQQLLAFFRIRVSSHCFFVKKMFTELRKGRDAKNYVLQSDENKHVFDAMSYALIMECAEELDRSPRVYAERRGGLAVCIT